MTLRVLTTSASTIPRPALCLMFWSDDPPICDRASAFTRVLALILAAIFFQVASVSFREFRLWPLDEMGSNVPEDRRPISPSAPPHRRSLCFPVPSSSEEGDPWFLLLAFTLCDRVL